MKTHPVDPVALVAGLLFTLSGLVLLADEHWADLDVTALSAAGLTAIGLILAIAVIVRFTRPTDPEPVAARMAPAPPPAAPDDPTPLDDTVELADPTPPEPPPTDG